MSLGINLRVTGHSNQGGRKYMEDYFSVAYQASEIEKNDVEYAYFGIFDGHGGSEAAKFAKDHLLREIVNNKLFWSKYDSDVLRAIREGYISTHYAMWREQEKWPKTATGLPSTAGTTASVAFIFRKKIYIGHVGDSGIVLGYQDEGDKCWKAKSLTQDHKPECNIEKARIINSGGKVVTKSGVPRVVWNRPRVGHKGPVRRSTPFDEIPFLAVARSLGDLWSYNSALNQFIVSPDPDVRVVKIDSKSFRCLIFGTDGLWNVVTADQAVDMARDAEIVNERLIYMGGSSNEWTNPSKFLVEKALERWNMRRMRADNTSVITVFLDQPGQPKKSITGNSNGIIDRCSNTTRYELKYEMQNEFNPEHIIYNRYDEINRNSILTSGRFGTNKDYYYDQFHENESNSFTSSIINESCDSLLNSVESLGNNEVGNNCYSGATLQFSPTLSNNSANEGNAMNGFTVIEHYNTNCDTDYSYYDSPLSSDNSSSNYKYDNSSNRDILNVINESFISQSNSSVITPISTISTFESNFDLINRLDDTIITANQHNQLTNANTLPRNNNEQNSNNIEINNDGSHYSHSFAESYNSLLISSLENESSSSSSSDSSGSSSNSCSSKESTSSSDISSEEEYCDGQHSYKSLNETGIAGHDYVFQHFPNTSNEEQQQQYQEACMLHEDGYSLTKLETRVEQRLRNNNNIVINNNKSSNNLIYSNIEQPLENHSIPTNNVETFQTFNDLDTEINTYNQYNNVTSSFSINNNGVENNCKNSNNIEFNLETKSNISHCDITLSIQSNSESNIKSSELTSIESGEEVLSKSDIEMETEILDEEEIEILNADYIEETVNDKRNSSHDKSEEYLLEENIQINEISSSSIESISPIPSLSSSNFKLEKLEIEPTSLSCIEDITISNATSTSNLSSKLKQNYDAKKLDNEISALCFKSHVIDCNSNFPPDKQNENENTPKQNNNSNFIRRSLRSFNNNINKKYNSYNYNNSNRKMNIKNNNSLNNNEKTMIINNSLSKDMKTKKNVIKNKSTVNNITKSIVAKEFLKLVNSSNSISNNNIILNKLRSRQSTHSNNTINSSTSQSSENLVSTPKLTIWSKRSRRTIQTSLNNNSPINNSNRSNLKLKKALCTNNTVNKNVCSTNSTTIVTCSTNNSNNSSNSRVNTNYKFQNNSNHKIQKNTSLTSLLSVSSTSSKSATNYISTKRSSTSRNSAWCPNKKTVQTRNRVQKR